MTALGGFWTDDRALDPREAARQVLAAQSVFGLHGTAIHRDGGLALGRNLHRLVPEDAFDRGPQVSPDGAFALVADVRLDNRDDLTAELGLDPMGADGMCDAALVLRAFEAWAERALERFVGPFAIALWERARGTVLLARDPIGHRPLHYARLAGGFAFASMPRGLFALDGVPRKPDEGSAARLLALQPEADARSFFAGIARVMPGERVLVTREGVERRRYWHPRGPTRRSAGSGTVAELDRLFDRAVKSALRGAEERVGAHLSAGLDSTAVATSAARQLEGRGGTVFAFTASPREPAAAELYPDQLADERPIAAATAAMYPSIEHISIANHGRLPTEVLAEDLAFLDRPSLNPINMVWVQSINAAARERGLTVMLTGQMGNLTISYPGTERLARLFATGAWGRLLVEAAALVRARRARMRSLVGLVLGPALGRLRPRRAREARRATALARLSAVRRDVLDRVLGEAGLLRTGDPIAVRVAALGGVDPGNFNKAVLASHGIDMRDPTADLRVVEFCLALPLDAYCAGGVTRKLARDLLGGRVPQALLDERRKGVQAADWSRSLDASRPDIEREVALMKTCPAAMRLIDVDRLKRLIAEWPAAWTDRRQVADYSLALMRAVAVGHFLRNAGARAGAEAR